MKNTSNQAAVTARPHFATPYLDKLAFAADAALSAGTITAEEHAELMEGLCQYTATNPLLPYKCKEIELRILAAAPAENTHVPFQFKVLGEIFDVRPFFSVLEISCADGLASVIDSAISDLIRYAPTDDFTDRFKNDLWHLRELRDAIMAGAGAKGLSSWNRDVENETIASNHILFDGGFLQNRLK